MYNERSRSANELLARESELAAEIARPFRTSGMLVRAYSELPEIDLQRRVSDSRLVIDALRRAERPRGTGKETGANPWQTAQL